MSRGLRPKTQLCDQITSRNLHGNFTGCYKAFPKISKGSACGKPHGWSDSDHDALFGRVSLVTLLSLGRSCCFGHLLLFGPKVAGWSHFALGPFGHVCLFGAGPLLKHISLFGAFGHVSSFAARSRHGSQGPKRNFVIKSLHGTFMETPRGVAKFFPTAEQVGWCKWLVAAEPRIALWTIWECVTI